MKKYIYLSAAAMTLLAASCSNDDQANGASDVDNTGKTRIALSAGDDQNSFVVTRAGFKEQTRIVARIVSDSRLGGAAKCVRTVMLGDAAGTKDYSGVSYLDNTYTRYWDDAHGRNSRLSVYAVAVPNKNTHEVAGSQAPYIAEDKLQGANTWGTDKSAVNTISWAVDANQTTTTLEEQDLTYSNNIQETGDNGVYTWDYSAGNYPTLNPDNAGKHTWETTVPSAETHNDGRLYFTQQGKTLSDAVTDAAGHFDRGQMIFNHALTRVQVNLIKGKGYESGAFSVTDMQILGQSISGTFDIKAATWSDPAAATPINMARWASAAPRTDGETNAATYEAQMLPGYVFTDDNIANVLQLTVDGNTYYIMNKQLYTALGSHGKTTLSGNRYIFDITVAKNKIQNITATVVEWNNVTAENTNVDNSHYKFTFYKDGANVTSNVNLYKYEQTLGSLATGGDYSAAAVAAENPSVTYSAVKGFAQVTDKTYFTTSEYYNDNKTAYHFRALNGAAQSTLNSETGKVQFTMTYGTDTETTNDYVWGAPMKTGLSSDKLSYSTSKGYLDCIEKGIVAANTDLEENYINLTQVHMMSQLVIKLTSVSTDANAKVNLEGATVKITKFSKTGTVNMGSGLITPSTSYEDMETPVTVTTVDGVTSCKINVIPQSLVRGEDEEHRTDADYVGITIHTADNNEYYIVKRLSDIVGTAGSQITNMQTPDGKITDWYPGHKYIYTFNITKTEIKNITATIVGWNEVNAGNTDLDLEK